MWRERKEENAEAEGFRLSYCRDPRARTSAFAIIQLMRQKSFFISRVVNWIAFFAAVACSLLILCIYVRSYLTWDLPGRSWYSCYYLQRGDSLYKYESSHVILLSANGSLAYCTQYDQFFARTKTLGQGTSVIWHWDRQSPVGHKFGRWGFTFNSSATSVPPIHRPAGMTPYPPGRHEEFTISIPDWLPLMAFLALACASYRRGGQLRVKARLADGLCPQCSYDLRAHQSGDKCPDCGTLISKQNSPAAMSPSS